MGAFFSTVTSYGRLAKILSSNSFNNTTALTPNQQPLSILAQGEPATPIDITTVSGQPEILLVNAPTTTSGNDVGDNRAQDDSKPILIGVAAAVVAGSFTILANPPTSVQNILVLYNIYMLFLLLSFVLSTGSLFFILTTTPSLGGAWVQKKALKIAIVSLIISVTLRIFLQLSTPIKWYDVLIPLLLVGGIILYLWHGWMKANNSRQTSNPSLTTALTSSYTSEV